ncbi:MAG: hypothetical protein U5K79_13205, partial [Cyclobacteriaceae bacterium]|nr:hypothetical protein [Cyclobacteriaceae bacterium]
LQILPLLRPFALALVIIFWPAFVDLINGPMGYITDKSKAMFSDRIVMVDAVAQERMILIDSVARRLIETSAEIEQVQNGSTDASWYETLGVDFDALFDQMKGYFIIIMAKMRFFFMQVIEFLVITVFQVCSYFVFFIQIVFGAILVILGPFAFAFSVLPGFLDAYIHWIARYLSVSLYSSIGYIVMSMCMVVVQYGIERETELLRYILSNEAAFILYVSQNDGGANFFIISLLLGGLVMLTIPVISTWNYFHLRCQPGHWSDGPGYQPCIHFIKIMTYADHFHRKQNQTRLPCQPGKLFHCHRPFHPCPWLRQGTSKGQPQDHLCPG